MWKIRIEITRCLLTICHTITWFRTPHLPSTSDGRVVSVSVSDFRFELNATPVKSFATESFLHAVHLYFFLINSPRDSSRKWSKSGYDFGMGYCMHMPISLLAKLATEHLFNAFNTETDWKIACPNGTFEWNQNLIYGNTFNTVRSSSAFNVALICSTLRCSTITTTTNDPYAARI